MDVIHALRRFAFFEDYGSLRISDNVLRISAGVIRLANRLGTRFRIVHRSAGKTDDFFDLRKESLASFGGFLRIQFLENVVYFLVILCKRADSRSDMLHKADDLVRRLPEVILQFLLRDLKYFNSARQRDYGGGS